LFKHPVDSNGQLLLKYCSHRPDILELFAPNFDEQVMSKRLFGITVSIIPVTGTVFRFLKLTQVFASDSAFAQQLILEIVNRSSAAVVRKVLDRLLANFDKKYSQIRKLPNAHLIIDIFSFQSFAFICSEIRDHPLRIHLQKRVQH
jgi:hypothetical protein